MPTYEYICDACHHGWEAFQSINAQPLSECPSCHQATARRQISLGGGFILKGGGWYSDLYSSTSGRPKGDGGSSSSGSSEGGGTKASGSGESSKTAPAVAAE